MAHLAINGGPKTRIRHFPKHPIIGNEEKEKVMEVLDSGNISTFRTAPGEHFLGGKKIREFEEKFANKIGSDYAISFNSASSELKASPKSFGVLNLLKIFLSFSFHGPNTNGFPIL